MTETKTETGTSRLPGFYRLDVGQRRDLIREAAGLELGDAGLVAVDGQLDVGLLDGFVENVIGAFGLELV